MNAKNLLQPHRVGALIALATIISLAVPLLIGGKQSLLDIRDLPAQAYSILFAVMAVCWLVRAIKLHLLLNRFGAGVSFARSFAMSLAIDFAFVSTPGGLGGYAASMYCARRAGISMSAATTVTFIDQLLDLMFFALALPLAALTLLWTNVPRALSLSAFIASAALILFALVVMFTHRRFVRWLCGDNIFSRRWPNLRDKQHRLLAFLDTVGADSRFLFSGPPLVTAALIGTTAIQWLTRYGVLWAALALLGHTVPFALTLLSQSLILHAALWTGVPSGGGGAELGLSAALIAMVPTSTIATALILWRLVTFHLCLVAGALAIAWLARSKAKSPSERLAQANAAE
jgi:glycosyltransferase 2 family protein